MATECVLGVDLGGTKIALAAVARDGSVLFRDEAPCPSHDGDLTIRCLLGLVGRGADRAGGKGLEVVAVGLGAAGFILYEEGVLMESPNISWSDVPLRRIVSGGTGLPVFLDNDANVAALGERLAGVSRGASDFVYLTLGTGIGGGICIGGEIYRGQRGTAAEIGHMIVDPEGPSCACGGRGCLEAVASGTALEREAARLAEREPGSLLNHLYGGEAGFIRVEQVAEAARKGDRAALEAFKKIARYLGIGITSLLHIFDPEMVVLGGGVSAVGDLFLEDVRDVVRERAIRACSEKASVALSALGRDAGLIGAAFLAWEGMGRAG